jgi:hypothetical protein
MKRILLVPVCVCSCWAQTSLNLTGSITGTLAGEDGSLIPAARITLLLSTSQNIRMRPRQTLWTAVTAAGGAFHFTGLNDGAYQLCAHVPASAWLNPCEWGLQPTTLSLSSSQPNATVHMVLKKGAAVSIRIDDPGQLLSQNEGRKPGAHLLLGVRNDASAICPARFLSQDTNGRNHEIVVPFNTTVNLVVQSSFFQVSNATGSPVGVAGPFVPVFATAGQQPPSVRLVVTGGGHP